MTSSKSDPQSGSGQSPARTNEPTPDNSSKEDGSVEIIYQLSKILTKDTPDKTQRLIVRFFTVTFPDYTFEFMPKDNQKFKYIRLSWQIGDNSTNYTTYEVTGQDNDDIVNAAYEMLIEKANEFNQVEDEDEYPVVRRRRRRSVSKE